MGLFKKKQPPPAPIPAMTRENFTEVLYMSYEQKMLPMEKRHIYDQFYTPPLYRAEFDAKPMVLFLGQYSVGKTSMIKFLLNGVEYPGSIIGPEPTTDCFTVIYHSANATNIMGTSLVTDNTLPFQSLNMFGSAFLTRMRGATLPNKLLEHITLMDTPGILSGEKQRNSRGYDFASVVNYIAGKVDMIVLLFDTSKLDISDEYKQVIQCLKGNEEKIKIVLNKADQVGAAELIRVRGALMWSLSRILESPEVPKVFVGSFCNDCRENIRSEVHEIFTQEYVDFFDELKLLPSSCNVRKLNDIIKRAKKLKTHALVMEQLLKQMWFKSKGELQRVVTVQRLNKIFDDFKYRLRIADSDLPNIEIFVEKAQASYIKGWNKIDKEMMQSLEQFINDDIPKIVAIVQSKDKKIEIPSVLVRLFKDLISSEVSREGTRNENIQKKSKTDRKKKSHRDEKKEKENSAPEKSKSKSKKEKE